MLNFLLANTAFLAFFIIIEFGSRYFQIKANTSRKIVHIGSGLGVAILPRFLTWPQITLLGAVFCCVLLVSRQLHILKSIHAVDRRSWGELYFPLVLVFLSLMNPPIIPWLYAVLVLTFADGLAGLIGPHVARRTYKSFGSTKSLEGSTVFFATSLVIGLALNLGWYSILGAVVLTAVEGILGFGLDNLAIPIIAIWIARLVYGGL
jgi:phytol kinase